MVVQMSLQTLKWRLGLPKPWQWPGRMAARGLARVGRHPVRARQMLWTGWHKVSQRRRQLRLAREIFKRMQQRSVEAVVEEVEYGPMHVWTAQDRSSNNQASSCSELMLHKRASAPSNHRKGSNQAQMPWSQVGDLMLTMIHYNSKLPLICSTRRIRDSSLANHALSALLATCPCADSLVIGLNRRRLWASLDIKAMGATKIRSIWRSSPRCNSSSTLKRHMIRPLTRQL